MKRQNYRNPYQYNYVCSTNTICNIYSSVLECPSNPVSHIGHWRSNCPMEEISENEASEDKCSFLSRFHFLSDDFDMDSHNFDFDILRNKANVKESLHKNLEHWHHIGPNPSVIDTIENGYSRFNNFVLWNNQSALQNEYFETHTVKKLLKSGRIKETGTPFYIVNPLTVAKNSHKKTRFILDLWDTQFFLFIRSE